MSSILGCRRLVDRRDIESAGMWVTDQHTYAVGFDRQKKAMRTFALDRIRGARVGEDLFAPRADFDVASYFRGAITRRSALSAAAC